jgi:chromosome partitioning protein
MIISVLNQKGGAGKTTIATNLACAIAQAGHSVTLIDSDEQGSARDWHAAAATEPEVDVIALDRPGMLETAKKLPSDFIVIDGSARADKIAVAAVKISDLVLLPIQPSPYDVWAMADLIELVKQRIEITDRQLQAAFVISRAIPNTLLAVDVHKALEEHGLTILKGTTQRQVYAQAAAKGQSVLMFEPNGKAAAEILALLKDIL